MKGRNDYNKIAKNFSDTRAFAWKELVPLAEHVKTKDKVLDLGCGNGRLFSLLKDKNIEYTGVDSSAELINIAKSKYWKENPKFQVVEALNLPFSDDHFDKVFSIAVLHHIPSDKFRMKFLEEIKRVLKPKGSLVFTVWNLKQKKEIKTSLFKYTLLKSFGKTKLDKGDIFYPWKGPDRKEIIQRYFHCFTKKELVNLTGRAGFTVKEAGFLPRGSVENANIYLIAEK